MKTLTPRSTLLTVLFFGIPVFWTHAQHTPQGVLDSLFQEAGTHAKARAFDKALEVMAGAEALARQAFGEESAEYGRVCYHYGLAYHQKGDHPVAEKWLLRANDILEKTLGRENAEYAAVLHHLGVVYYHMGNNYEKAEYYFIQARDIRGKILGKMHLDYALTLLSLGDVYYFMSNYNLAEQCYRESLTSREQILGKESIPYGESLRKIANVYMVQGRYKEAEALYQINLNIVESEIGDDNIPFAAGLMTLAWSNEKMGYHDRAESMYLRVVRVLEALPAFEDIPTYMSCLEFLGELYFYTGQYGLSETYHIRAKDLRERVLGKQHLSYEMSLANLALLYWTMGSLEKAEAAYAELTAMQKSFLSRAIRHLSEEELTSYIARFEGELAQHYSFVTGHDASVPSSTGACYDNTLFHKGFILDAASRYRSLRWSWIAMDNTFSLLDSYHRQLSSEYSKRVSNRDSNLIEELENNINVLEKDLARTVAGFSEAIRQVHWREVQAALAPHEAALEFVHFKYYTPEPTDSVLYAALLLRPGMETPRFIPLFEEQALEALLPPLEKNRREYVDKLYHNDATTRLVWSPVEAHLQDVKTVYYAPSGLLHRLNLGALPVPGAVGEAVVADRYDIVLLGSTRQLAGRAADSPIGNAGGGSPSSDAAVFGAVNYDIDSTAVQPMGTDDPNTADHRGLSFAENDASLRDGEWWRLKYSGRETANVAAILEKAGMQVEMRQGSAATEEAFKRMGEFDPVSSPRILHFSTHGFFFPDPVSVGGGQTAEPGYKVAEHPMIRSGLILAGANYAWIHGKPLGHREDGVLTAYEISQLDLRHTELVVLSACETGLGDIRGNEGVYGLQRAFKIAGAKNLVMSLWQVPDYPTQELMTAFYQKWLIDQLPLRQALQSAQKAMRDKGYDPYHWAGWVLVE